MTNSLIQHLEKSDKTIVKQRRELLEFIGLQSRNKYEFFSEQKMSIGFCAEQNKGFFGFLFRQLLRHWRRFNLVIFDENKQPLYHVKHPFRFFFQRLEVYEIYDHDINRPGNCVGVLQQRFGIFTKKFDLEDGKGNRIAKMRSGFFKIWTFPVKNNQGLEIGKIEKKWGGILKEIFTDQDSFLVSYDERLPLEEKILLLASSIFIDLKYFEDNEVTHPLNFLGD